MHSEGGGLAKRELWYLAAVAAFGLVLIVLDSFVTGTARTQKSAAAPFVSAGWYCPAPAVDGIDAIMSAANWGRRPVHIRRLAVGDGNESAPLEGPLAARRRSSVPLQQLSPAKAMGLTEAFGRTVLTDLAIASKDHGIGASPCSSRPGSRWLFASGSTLRRQDHYLLVANPFREEAVIQVRIMEPAKEMVPSRLKDLVVAPLSQTSVFLSDYVTETPSFGMEVIATQGRIVVSRYSQLATREGINGVSLNLGEQQPRTNLNFAGGGVPSDGEELIALANPNPKEALVQVIFQTDKEQIAPAQLDEVAVAAGRQVKVRVSDFLPRGTLHSTRIVSTNGVGVVAERETTAAVAGGRGYETVLGVAVPARRWAVAAGSGTGGTDSIAILNSGEATARVAIALLSEKGEIRPPELQNLRVGKDRRSTVDLDPFLAGGVATALVTSSSPIAVENLLTAGSPFSDFASSAGGPVE